MFSSEHPIYSSRHLQYDTFNVTAECESSIDDSSFLREGFEHSSLRAREKGAGDLMLIQFYRSRLGDYLKPALSRYFPRILRWETGLRILKRLCRHSYAEAKSWGLYTSNHSSRRLYDYYWLTSAVTCADDAVFLIVHFNAVSWRLYLRV